MPSFKRLASLAVRDDSSSVYVMGEVDGSPRLTVRPATEANRPFFNARLSESRGMARAVRSGGVTVALMAENRRINRKLFPRHVVTGWDEATVLDDAGKPVPYSRENCEAFLDALPDHVFDGLSDFCEQPASFTGQQVDAEAVAKN